MSENDLDFGPADESAPSNARGFEVKGQNPPTGRPELSTATMAELYMKQGHYQKAAPIWAALLAKSPTDPTILARLTECQRQLAAAAALPNAAIISTLERWLANARRMQGRAS